MAGNITSMSLSITGLSETNVDTLVTFYTDYLVLPNPRISASVSFPSQPLDQFNPGVYAVTFIRTNPTEAWQTKETDLMVDVISLVALPTP